jgi:CRISPR-associated protein Cmr1
MSRKSTKTPPSVTPKKKKDFISETRKYKLITPLYGGGVEPEKADPITIVRATEVRGHLRFWWRATRGGAFGGSLEKMREREEEIFGSAAGKDKNGKDKSGPSQVIIQIILPTKGRVPKNIRALDNDGFGYVAFPLRDSNGNVEENVSFTLQIDYPKDKKKDIEAVLWAWETFGGIGGRTRRGFGALQRTDISIPKDLTSKDAKKWIEAGLSKYIDKDWKWHSDVPHLSLNLDDYKITSQKNNGIASWKSLVLALQKFRQADARYKKDTGLPDRYGMSRWPEPNEVRRLFGRNPALPRGITKSDLVQKFPRAEFGLPIILHMAHDDGLKNKNISLEGKNYDRLTSPLILRPLSCKDGAVGLAVILETPRTPPDGLILKGTPRGDEPVESNLGKYEAKKIPMLDGETDILKAFLAYLD